MNTPVLSVKNLQKKFGSHEVLKGVSFDVFPGEIIGYIGPNGAGKSTTVKIFLGMLEKTSGDITIFGSPLTADAWAYKRHIGYVPEQSEMYENLTAEE